MRADPVEQGEPTATTAEDVKRWLTAFFLDLPNAPVYSAAGGRPVFVDPNRSPSGLDWPAFSAEVLGRRSRDRLFLLTYARCEAGRQAVARKLPTGPAGGSIREFCREYGVARSSFVASVNRSLATLAAEWDRRRAG